VKKIDVKIVKNKDVRTSSENPFVGFSEDKRLVILHDLSLLDQATKDDLNEGDIIEVSIISEVKNVINAVIFEQFAGQIAINNIIKKREKGETTVVAPKEQVILQTQTDLNLVNSLLNNGWNLFSTPVVSNHINYVLIKENEI
jgi:hypothetical protein